MKVDSARPITAVERAPSTEGASAKASAPTDRVSTDATKSVVSLAEATQAKTAQSRVSRLKEIEAAVKAGAYRPNPSQIAEEILSAAEVDARLRALFKS